MQEQKRAQIIPEFIIITAVVLSVMLFVFVIAADKSEDSLTSRKYLAAKTISDEVALSINQVHLGGPETSRSMWLPEKLRHDTAYEVYLIPRARVVRVMWNTTKAEVFYDTSLLTSKFNITPNNNKITNSYRFPKGQINLSNDGGTIRIAA